MKKIFLVTVSVCIIFALYLMLNEERETRDSIPFRTNSYIEGLRIVHKKDGQNSWTLRSQRADLSQSETVAHMDRVTINLTKENLILKADRGLYNLDNKNLTLEGNIKAHTKDYVITAESLGWKSSTGELVTDGSIQMYGKKFMVEGNGMRVTPGQKVRLLKNVKAIFYP